MPDRFRFSVVSSALGDEVRQVPRLARKAGFDGVQLDAHSPPNLADLSASGRRELRRLFSSQGQHIESLRLDLGPRGLGRGADVDREIHLLETAMEAAATLCTAGPACLCVDAGPLPAPAAEAPPVSRPAALDAGLIILPTAADIGRLQQPPVAPAAPFDAASAAQVDAALVEIGNRAEKYQVVVAMRSELATLPALERALRAANCPWFGFDLDPVAALRDGADVDRVFSILAPWVRHVRGRDATAGSGGRTKPAALGQGSIDWRQWLAALDDAGFSNGWIAVDPLELPDRAAAASAGLEHLQKARR